MAYENEQLSGGEKIRDSFGKINRNSEEASKHINNQGNKHNTDNIKNNSSVSGENASEALNYLKGQIDAVSTGDSNALIGVYKATDNLNTNDYEITIEGLTYYTDLRVNLSVNNTNTGSATLNINGLGKKDIKYYFKDNNTKYKFSGGELVGYVELQYDGADFVVVGKDLAINIKHDSFGVYDQITDAVIDSSYTGVLPITYHKGILYGLENNTTFVVSYDEGDNWETLLTSPLGSVHKILFCDDGEVLICNTSVIQKSTGFPSVGTTWTTVVEKSAPAGNGILPWGFNGNGTKFIAAEYSGVDRGESRYIWISTDSGTTWDIVYDKYTTDPTNTSHMHGVCYHEEMDIFFVSHGHGILRGIEYSIDDGATWEKLQGDFKPDASPTVLHSLKSGIIIGSDSNEGGLYGIAVKDNPEDLRMKRTYRWNTGVNGVIGFGYNVSTDTITDTAFMTFTADSPNVKAAILAGSPVAGSLVWESETIGDCKFLNVVATDNYLIALNYRGTSYELIKMQKPTAGQNTYDTSGILSGKSLETTTIAAGPNVNTEALESVIIGANSELTGTDSMVAIGNEAIANTRSTVVGNNAVGNTTDTVTIGNDASTKAILGVSIGSGSEVGTDCTYGVAIGGGSEAGAQGVAIGGNASTGNTTSTLGATAIGHDSTSNSLGVAIGRESNANSRAVAIGYTANAEASDAVAIGDSSLSSGTLSVAVGKNSSVTSGSLYGIAIGGGSEAGSQSVAVGGNASAGNVSTEAGRTAIGHDAVAGNFGVSVGMESASGTYGVAIGYNSESANLNSVALGKDTTTTQENQVAIDARHVSLKNVTATPVSTTGESYLYTKDNGSGKRQLCVRFGSEEIILATES